MANPSNFQQRIFVGDGSANGPSLSFLDDTQSGFYLKSSGVVGLSISGTEVLNWSSSGQSEVGGVFLAANGLVSAPSFSFTGDPDNGMYLTAVNTPCFAAGGVDIFNISSSGLNIIGTNPLTIAKTSNQVVLGTTNLTTISATAPAASVTYTIPDQGGAANFVLSAGTAQSISSALTLSSALAVTPTTNQLVLGTTRTVTISASQPATSSRVYTIPDQGAAANFLMSAAAQTIAGVQTFSAQLLGADGSTSAPEYANSTGKTGLAFSGETILFCGNSAQRASIDANGNLQCVNGLATNRSDVASAATITALSASRSFVRLTGSTATALQGIGAGVDGQRIVLFNNSGQNLTIQNENAGASAANRITTMTGGDIATTANGASEFIYDTGSSRWICLYVTA